MEFVGDAISQMNMEERMTMCNMVVEAGGKNGVCPADQTTFDYVEARTSEPYNPSYSDESASFFAGEQLSSRVPGVCVVCT
jgi:3-isopropylmalate/(R)-2-methylmalate dehydratase large subunit